MKNIPFVTVDQMREVDRLMVEDIGVSILMMMENASQNIAFLSRKILGGSVRGKHIVILCGKGNNGGDGLGAARHLINLGADVKCFLTVSREELGADALVQYQVLANIQASLYGPSQLSGLPDALRRCDLVIDALIGYNLRGNPHELMASFINLANASGKPILAVDLPSGLDGDRGEVSHPNIKAATTLTLALPKAGLLEVRAKEYVGELYLADLSVPEVVYEKLGLKIPVIFEKEAVIKLF